MSKHLTIGIAWSAIAIGGYVSASNTALAQSPFGIDSELIPKDGVRCYPHVEIKQVIKVYIKPDFFSRLSKGNLCDGPGTPANADSCFTTTSAATPKPNEPSWYDDEDYSATEKPIVAPPPDKQGRYTTLDIDVDKAVGFSDAKVGVLVKVILMDPRLEFIQPLNPSGLDDSSAAVRRGTDPGDNPKMFDCRQPIRTDKKTGYKYVSFEVFNIDHARDGLNIGLMLNKQSWFSTKFTVPLFIDPKWYGKG
jgi:hypothetical protein